ncbi:MAG: ABC transporter ATP-binding protein [Planctomycetota bacterium]|nr:ABC transporter ATP-binding protein [Planctomycetota bacterium]MDI6787678.1 ABC transporter ATP-binding protein [Planctomycetota bacterium]
MIEIHNIKKEYNRGTTKVEALKGVSFSIEDGDMVALMGASGCGKSTLLSLIGGLDKSTSGSIIIDKENISELDARKLAGFRRAKAGFVFQQFHLIPTLSVVENVMLPLLPIKMKKAECYRIAMEVIEKVGLQTREKHLPGELSGGEQQRVAIARALVNKPGIILADEPTGDLDSKTGANILHLLADLNKKEKRTIIIATHDNKIGEIAKRKVVLEDGAVVSDTRREELRD